MKSLSDMNHLEVIMYALRVILVDIHGKYTGVQGNPRLDKVWDELDKRLDIK